MTRRAAMWVLLVLGCLYVMSRWAYFSARSVWPDEALYMWQVGLLSEDLGALFSKDLWGFGPPLFQLIAAPLNVFFDADTGARVMVGVFGAGCVALTYLIGVALRDRFTGLAAATLLCLNPVFWLIGTRALLDVPLTFWVLLSVLGFARLKNRRTRLNLVLLVVGVIGAALTKRVGLVAAVFVALAFALEVSTKVLRDPRPIRQRPRLIIAVIAGSLALVALYVAIVEYRPLFFKYDLVHLLRKVGSLSGLVGLPVTATLTTPILVLVTVGLGLTLVLRPRRMSIPILLIVSTLRLRVLFVSVAQPRYHLPTLPGVLLLGVLGFAALKDRFAKANHQGPLVVVMFVMMTALAWPGVAQARQTLKHRALSYTGFREAGRWLKQHAEDDARIFGGSARALRLYSGRRIHQPPRRLSPPRGPTTNYLVIDFWERDQPPYAYPMRSGTEQKLAANHWRLVKTVVRPARTSHGMKRGPVVYIFKDVRPAHARAAAEKQRRP